MAPPRKRKRVEREDDDDDEEESRVRRSRRGVGRSVGARRGTREVRRRSEGREGDAGLREALANLERQMAKVLAQEAEILARLRGMEKDGGDEDEEMEDGEE